MSNLAARWLPGALLALAVLWAAGDAWARPASDRHAANTVTLDERKLQLEVEKLEEERRLRPEWLSTLLGGLAGIGGTAASWWLARRARHGELDKVVHQQRIDVYPALVHAGLPLALYFPGFESPLQGTLGAQHCRAVGTAMSAWYFSRGGLLLSVQARDAYFGLMRALTLASLAEAPLLSPKFPDDAALISVELVDQYRQELEATHDLDAADAWSFGASLPSGGSAAQRFRDYIFLQRLVSRLRSSLSDDLRSRRGPS